MPSEKKSYSQRHLWWFFRWAYRRHEHTRDRVAVACTLPTGEQHIMSAQDSGVGNIRFPSCPLRGPSCASRGESSDHRQVDHCAAGDVGVHCGNTNVSASSTGSNAHTMSSSTTSNSSRRRVSFNKMPHVRDRGPTVTLEMLMEDKVSVQLLIQSLTGTEQNDMLLMAWHGFQGAVCLGGIIVALVMIFFFSEIVSDDVLSSADMKLYKPHVNTEAIPPNLDFGILIQEVGGMLMTVNVLYLGCTILFMTYSLHMLPFSLTGLTIVMSCVTLSEIIVISIVIQRKSHMLVDITAELKDKLTDYQIRSNASFDASFDVIAMWTRCCGIVDRYDFSHDGKQFTYRLPSQKDENKYLYPPVCCPPSVLRDGMTAVATCMTDATGINDPGCLEAVYTWLKHYADWYNLVVVLHLVDMAVHTLLYQRHIELVKVRVKIKGEIDKMEQDLEDSVDDESGTDMRTEGRKHEQTDRRKESRTDKQIQREKESSIDEQTERGKD